MDLALRDYAGLPINRRPQFARSRPCACLLLFPTSQTLESAGSRFHGESAGGAVNQCPDVEVLKVEVPGFSYEPIEVGGPGRIHEG
jgi:hypothetical protein